MPVLHGITEQIVIKWQNAIALTHFPSTRTEFVRVNLRGLENLVTVPNQKMIDAIDREKSVEKETVPVEMGIHGPEEAVEVSIVK